MPLQNRISCILLISIGLIGTNLSGAFSAGLEYIEYDTPHFTYPVPQQISPVNSDLKVLNSLLKEHLINQNYKIGREIIRDIELKLNSGNQDSSVMADSYYYIGIFYQLNNDHKGSIQYLDLAILLKEKLQIYDEIYAKALYNLGAAYSYLGVFERHKALTLKSLEIEKNIYGPESPILISTYASLITAYIELKDYSNALQLANIAYMIADENAKSSDPNYIAFLYLNIGVLYNSIGDYSKSKVFFEKAEEYYNKANDSSSPGYTNLMQSMSTALKNLGFSELSEEYNKKGIELAKRNFSLSSYLILSIYADKLGKSGKIKEGESVIKDLLARVESRDGVSSQSYFEALSYYADYLRKFKIDNDKALELFGKCIIYFDNQGDSFLKFFVKEGCALLLSEKGEYKKSLEVLQTLLFAKDYSKKSSDIFINPDVDSLNADKEYLEVLKTKYKILKKYYIEVPDIVILKASASTSELIIALIDRIRIAISEEESRLLIGDRYRDSYIDVIRDFYNLYNKTSENYYLGKAFKYSEKSKIAGLLTATRELKATEFHIPPDLAEIEHYLQIEIALLNDRISGKTQFENRTEELIRIWKSNLFNTIRKRDSLINVFEKEYPGYYSIKYNTRVSEPDEIPGIIGKNNNYISYVAADTVIFINIVNRKYQKLISVSVDSSFYKKVKSFRNLLSEPDFNNARNDFESFKVIGFELFNTLISPVKPYLISERIVISPDNLLSYIPFETLPMKQNVAGGLSYKLIPYMMEKYDISYTYSATFLAENMKRGYRNGKHLIAFAPDYTDSVDISTLFQNRQQTGNFLSELPFAKQEAEYVCGIMGGKLVTNSNAKESVFKNEAGNYDIIHLAMHTVLDDNNPMYSTLIFSPDTSGAEDRFLRTYEIYGIPLKAKMVVLSSCNTGSGKLYSGEGILSLARGFIYSGSESVVMSMWEIEDRAGTEIVKLYYNYLRKGYSKSKSLKKARFEFLKSADQLRAHPYFWSALVVYGDNSALFKSRWIKVTIVLIILIIAAIFYYHLRKRRYS
jgi:CHAT domain-containing protein/tetratricopeptide (TPR) repeat protein